MSMLLNSYRFAPTFLPTDIANCSFWFDADDAATFTFSSGTIVSAWNDKSGNARHLAQATGSKQPDRSGTMNSRTTVIFALDDEMYSTDPGSDTAQPFTIFAAIRTPASLSGNRNMIGSSGNPAGPLVGYLAGTALGFYGGSTLTGGSLSTSTAYALQWTFNTTSSAGRINGGANALSGTSGGSATYRPVMLNNYRNDGFPSGGMAGDYAEVVGYSAALSISDIDRVGNYLAGRWGPTWTAAS